MTVYNTEFWKWSKYRPNVFSVVLNCQLQSLVVGPVPQREGHGCMQDHSSRQTDTEFPPNWAPALKKSRQNVTAVKELLCGSKYLHVFPQMTFTFHSVAAYGKCLGPHWWALVPCCRVFKVIEQIERVLLAPHCNVLPRVAMHWMQCWVLYQSDWLDCRRSGRLQSCPAPPSVAAAQCVQPNLPVCALSKSG